jgi:hypothetical protein
MRQLKGLRKERPGRHPLGVRLREYKSLRGRDLQEAGSFAFLAGKGACEHASSVTFATAVRRWCPSTESRLQVRPACGDFHGRFPGNITCQLLQKRPKF